MNEIQALLTREEPVRWVFAGDSITHGAAHTIGWRDYTELFSERVRWELRRTRDMVIKTGISGWQIGNLADDLDWNVLQFRPHCVSLMFGMNDCTRGTEGLAAFERQYIEVIDQIKAETGASVLLHTPNAICSSTGEPRLSHLASYREAILAISAKTCVPCIDHYAEWTSHEATGTMHHWLADGFHPNEYGHRAFARSLMRALDIWDPASWSGSLPIPSIAPVPVDA
jgi:acyl-CoA thioesterase I